MDERKPPPVGGSSRENYGNSRINPLNTTKSAHPPPVWDDFEGGGTPPVGPHSMPAIPCGLYEVDEPGGGTFQIRVRRRADNSNFAPGQWVMEYMLGADEQTWEAFAFLDNKKLSVFGRWKNSIHDKMGGKLFAHFDQGELFERWNFRLIEPRCARCGRMLKDSDIEAGISPHCAKEWGL